MITSVFIIGISVVLFVYWLRYSCVMVLRSAQDRLSTIASIDERFNVSLVVEQLKTAADLDSLERALDRDCRMVTYLIEHAVGLELASMENKLLVLDYKLMRLWSRLFRTVSPRQSRKALSEMAEVLSVLVAQVGQHSQLGMEA